MAHQFVDEHLLMRIAVPVLQRNILVAEQRILVDIVETLQSEHNLCLGHRFAVDHWPNQDQEHKINDLAKVGCNVSFAVGDIIVKEHIAVVQHIVEVQHTVGVIQSCIVVVGNIVVHNVVSEQYGFEQVESVIELDFVFGADTFVVVAYKFVVGYNFAVVEHNFAVVEHNFVVGNKFAVEYKFAAVGHKFVVGNILVVGCKFVVANTFVVVGHKTPEHKLVVVGNRYDFVVDILAVVEVEDHKPEVEAEDVIVAGMVAVVVVDILVVGYMVVVAL